MTIAHNRVLGRLAMLTLAAIALLAGSAVATAQEGTPSGTAPLPRRP